MFGHLFYRKHILGHDILFKGVHPRKMYKRRNLCHLTAVAISCVMNETRPTAMVIYVGKLL